MKTLQKKLFKAFIGVIAVGTSFAQVLPFVVETEPEPVTTVKQYFPYRFAVRTNILYDVVLLPTLGVEWRITPKVGVKMDGSFASWGNESGVIQKMWLVNPEVRWYMGNQKRFYMGVSANFGEADIYEGIVYRILNYFYDDNDGAKGSFRNIGFTVGYQLYLTHNLSIDFNFGLGYTYFKYNTYIISDGIRVPVGEENRTANLWGPSQAGVSLIWTIGGK